MTTHTLASFTYESSRQYLQNTHVYILCVYRSQQLIPSPHSYILPSIFTKHTCVYTCVYTSHTHVMRQTLQHSNTSPPINIYKTHRCIFMCMYITHTCDASHFASFIHESSHKYLQKTHVNIVCVHTSHTHMWWVTLCNIHMWVLPPIFTKTKEPYILSNETYILSNVRMIRESANPYYGVATISRLLKNRCLFCRMSSLLQGSFIHHTCTHILTRTNVMSHTLQHFNVNFSTNISKPPTYISYIYIHDIYKRDE